MKGFLLILLFFFFFTFVIFFYFHSHFETKGKGNTKIFTKKCKRSFFLLVILIILKGERVKKGCSRHFLTNVIIPSILFFSNSLTFFFLFILLFFTFNTVTLRLRKLYLDSFWLFFKNFFLSILIRISFFFFVIILAYTFATLFTVYSLLSYLLSHFILFYFIWFYFVLFYSCFFF